MRFYETYKPNAKQAKFHAIHYPPGGNVMVKAAVGGLGGGKSTACEQEQGWTCLKTPGGISVATRFTKKDTEATLLRDFKRILSNIAVWKEGKSTFIFPNDHQLMVLPAERFDRFGSMPLVTFYIQEAQEIEWEVFDALTQRVGRDPRGMVEGVPYWRGLFDARGVEDTHWIYKDFIEKAWNTDSPERSRQARPNPAWTYTKFSTYDNKEVLDRENPGYIQQQILNHKNDPRWVKVFIEGEIGIAMEGRRVFPEYDPALHRASITPDPTLDIYRGVDFGYRSPAVTWSQLTRDGRFVVLGELTPTHIARSELVSEVEAYQRQHFPDRPASAYRDFGDVAGTQENSSGVTDVEFWENHFASGVESRKSRITDGCEIIRSLMTRNKLFNGVNMPMFMIDQSCTRLHGALMGGYRFEKPDAFGQASPVKGNGFDDVVDSVRYVATVVMGDSDPFAANNSIAASEPASYGRW